MSLHLSSTKVLHFSRHTFLILALIIMHFYILIMMGSIFKALQSLSICAASMCWYFPTLVEHTWCRGGKKQVPKDCEWRFVNLVLNVHAAFLQ